MEMTETKVAEKVKLNILNLLNHEIWNNRSRFSECRT